jgi:hypothetical protein
LRQFCKKSFLTIRIKKCHQHHAKAMLSDEDPSNVPRKVTIHCQDAHTVTMASESRRTLCLWIPMQMTYALGFDCDYMHFEGNKHSFYRSRRKTT